MTISITKSYHENTTDLDKLDIEYDISSPRPVWIWVKDKGFRDRFLSARLDNASEVIYKRFTGNFYYPVELTLDKDEEQLFYQKYAQMYDTFTAKNNLPMAQFILDKLISYKVTFDAKILDLGAGTGLFSQLAAKAGYKDITLLDVSEAMLKVARSKPELVDFKFITSDVVGAKLTEVFDIVVSIMMFDGLSNAQTKLALDNLKSHLSPNAYIFIVSDKASENFAVHFKHIESGQFVYSPKDNSTKFYAIYQNI